MTKDAQRRLELDKSGSALIMTVVLTVLLAIVAVTFVIVARLDSAATSNIADNRMLNSAAKSIIEIINQRLISDTPGIGGTYYDYPDSQHSWLASIEPYLYDSNKSTADANYGVCRWRQISDIGNYFSNSDRQDVSVGSDVIKDGAQATAGGLADADGDGIADSKWFELKDLCTSKGKKIYAAVRIIDNSGMINVNTADTFNPAGSISEIDGNSQMQINLAGLLKSGESITALHNSRCGGGASADYEKNVIWGYGPVYNTPTGNYTPFDISDELELRYRYCIDSKFKARVEANVPDTIHLSGSPNHGMLYDDPGVTGIWGLDDWQRRIVNPADPEADRRHLLTTLNLDRIIDPCGVKMTNINTADVSTLYDSIRKGLLDANPSSDVNDLAAQIAVNIIDYHDDDSNVTVFHNDSKDYYGFARPCAYISELAYEGDPNDGNSFAIELYKPYADDNTPNGWELYNGGTLLCTINWPDANKDYHVVKWEHKPVFDVNLGASRQDEVPGSSIFDEGGTISLTRKVGGSSIVVDSVVVSSGWMPTDGNIHSLQRDVTLNKCIRRLWDSNDSSPTLGRVNDYNNGDSIFIQAHPKNLPFTNVGEIGMIFRKPTYYPLGGNSNGVIGYDNSLKEEYQVRLNLADPCFQQIFNYLTVWPRSGYALGPYETIKGRININTAPAFVIAQLPWVSLRNNPTDYNDPNLAKAIVAYRDKTSVPSGDPNYSNRSGTAGFKSIGELCDVNLGNDPNFRIDYYALDNKDQLGPPDLTPGDGAPDDFEERDLIFARISDLVTVRSDIFTAYILVRIGTDGPQKRYTVIFDRSEVTPSNHKVAIRAFQVTPEAR